MALATQLEVAPSKVVAVMPFSDPTTERIVRGYAGVLRKNLERDGLTVEDSALEEVRPPPLSG